tara:strand:+ start:496 stop:786 length:291 start_codon:yes stop_codon:yes gene_type:complete
LLYKAGFALLSLKKESLFMILKTKLIGLPLMALLLQSCGLSALVGGSKLNESALYDPPTITLIEGQFYQFQEGILPGRGQKFHNDYSYRRAIIIGK